jgi:hypothetical protein
VATESNTLYPKNQRILISLIVLITVYIWSMMVSASLASSAAKCDYYASPTGTGDGRSSSSPFRVQKFWSVAAPGKTLCLLDGSYTGTESMIKPPGGLSGTPTNPITIKALNDGKVLIDGQNSRGPAILYQNDYFVLEGFNACCSNHNVITISGPRDVGNGSDHTIVRRVVAWDAFLGGNSKPFQIAYSKEVLLEDVAGFGTGRKIFEIYHSNKVTIRRAWGRWEGSTRNPGPKQTFACRYGSTGSTCENLLGTWSGEAQPEAIIPDQRQGIFVGSDLLLGSIAYIEHGAQYTTDRGVYLSGDNGIVIKDVVSYVGPSASLSHIKPFLLQPASAPLAANPIVTKITSIGGTTDKFGSEWKMTHRLDIATMSNAVNIFTGSTGAQVCYRYINGTLTTTPLWPWPMNQRILEATKMAGRSPVDVTATIERLFGSIPTQCRQSGE